MSFSSNLHHRLNRCPLHGTTEPYCQSREICSSKQHHRLIRSWSLEVTKLIYQCNLSLHKNQGPQTNIVVTLLSERENISRLVTVLIGQLHLCLFCFVSLQIFSYLVIGIASITSLEFSNTFKGIS
jgi:hypothetical protein